MGFYVNEILTFFANQRNTSIVGNSCSKSVMIATKKPYLKEACSLLLGISTEMNEYLNCKVKIERVELCQSGLQLVNISNHRQRCVNLRMTVCLHCCTICISSYEY
jgi:hypothetical protein